MLWPKKNSYKEFDNEKQFLQLENSPPPPHNFSNGPSLRYFDPWQLEEHALQLDINLTMNTKIAQLNKIPNAANCTSPRVP